MSHQLAATILLPTTADRGPLLPISVGSILNQSVTDLEVFIMGDGVTEATRQVIHELIRQDSRIRFFDHEKDSRRGELNRHAALQEARGNIIGYLCDRDIMLPNHVEIIGQLLSNADFAHTLMYKILIDDKIQLRFRRDFSLAHDRAVAATCNHVIPLSFGAHTLDMYHRLPFGWRTTPRKTETDTYMWRQFLAENSCRVNSSTIPTILYFKRGSHPGLPVAERLIELDRWTARVNEPDFLSNHIECVRDALIRDRSYQAARIDDLQITIEQRDTFLGGCKTIARNLLHRK
ncbi:MAG: glycosyltransferase involved in cell wall biosynthesis [Parasphingorhabdus sp.]|jgi:glycosyltransferase involved in cell wall biosynthesis